MSMYGKNHYNICKVISLQLIKKNKDKNKKNKNFEKKNKIQFTTWPICVTLKVMPANIV